MYSITMANGFYNHCITTKREEGNDTTTVIKCEGGNDRVYYERVHIYISHI